MNYITKIFRVVQLHHQPSFYFSSQKQSFSNYSEKIMQMITNLSSQNVTPVESSHIINIIRNIPLLQSHEQESSLKYLLTALYTRKVQIELLKMEQLQKLVKDFPVIKVELTLHIINQLKKDPNEENQAKINDLYLQCIKEILPKIKNEYDQNRTRAILYKSYGKHLLEQKSMKKGLQTLEHSIYEHKKLINNYWRRLDENLEKSHNKEKDNTENKRIARQVKLNALKQNIRKMIESMFEVMYTYFSTQQLRCEEQTPKQQKQTLFYTLSLIKECMQMKSIIKGMQFFSIHYHKLRRIELQLEYLIAQKTEKYKKQDEAIDRMKSFYKESLSDIGKSKQYAANMKEIALTLIQLKMHIMRHEKKQNMREELTTCALVIVDRLEKHHRQPMLTLLEEFIKQNICD